MMRHLQNLMFLISNLLLVHKRGPNQIWKNRVIYLPKWKNESQIGEKKKTTRQQKIYVDQQLCLLTETKFYTIITRSLKWKKEIWQSKREHHLGADSYNVFKWISKHIFLGKLVEQMGPKLLCLLNPEKPLSEWGNSPNRTMRAQERTVIGKLTESANSGIGSGNLYSAALQMWFRNEAENERGDSCAFLLIVEESCSLIPPPSKTDELRWKARRGEEEEKGEHGSSFEEMRDLLQ